MTVMTGRRNSETARTLEILEAARADAWNAYLETCRSMDAVRYEELEPWAWTRLQRMLDAIDVRQARHEKGAA